LHFCLGKVFFCRFGDAGQEWKDMAASNARIKVSIQRGKNAIAEILAIIVLRSPHM